MCSVKVKINSSYKPIISCNTAQLKPKKELLLVNIVFPLQTTTRRKHSFFNLFSTKFRIFFEDSWSQVSLYEFSFSSHLQSSKGLPTFAKFQKPGLAELTLTAQFMVV